MCCAIQADVYFTTLLYFKVYLMAIIKEVVTFTPKMLVHPCGHVVTQPGVALPLVNEPSRQAAV